MKLLIVTQKVDKNDPILGFFHRWIIEFTKKFEQVTVICLYKGAHDLPQNVKVLSLGKEKGSGRSQYLLNFYSYVWAERKNYDVVFVHMNQIYVILGAILWKLWGKKIYLWYTHRMVGTTLRLATILANTVFTASKESFRIKSSKVQVVGHGIDTDIFSPPLEAEQNLNSEKNSAKNGIYEILSVSRISEAKNQLVMVRVLKQLRDQGFKARLVIVGGPIHQKDEEYMVTIKKYVKENQLENEVEFSGEFAPDKVVETYRHADLFINLSNTGSLDKALLEAMACGLQIVTSNEAFKTIVPAENFTSLDPQEIALKIVALSKTSASAQLRQYVVEKNNIATLIPRISAIMQSI